MGELREIYAALLIVLLHLPLQRREIIQKMKARLGARLTYLRTGAELQI